MSEADNPFRGELLRPGNSGYDDARRVFNAMIDRHPRLIVRCVDDDDVRAGVAYARDRGLPLAIKGGGHSVAGTAMRDDGIVLDLSNMKHVLVDPTRRVVVAQAGLTLGELDRATSKYGFATPTGVVSVTGLSGLALGGGLGWLNGRHGLTCDNLISATVVLADGQQVVADADTNPDLYWAIRGGGGNFGVVTSFTLRLHEIGHVQSGGMGFVRRDARSALLAYHEIASSCPDDLTINASIYKNDDGSVGVGVGFCNLGEPATVEALLHPLLAVGPASSQVEMIPYTSLQTASDANFPEGRRHYWKSLSLCDISEPVIEAMLDCVGRMPSLASGIGFQQLHGLAAKIAPTDTAYAHRSNRYDTLILSQWQHRVDDEANITWTTNLFDAIRPFAAQGVYINNLGSEGNERIEEAYGPNMKRLGDIKRRLDPTNLFDSNQNISPAIPSIATGQEESCPTSS